MAMFTRRLPAERSKAPRMLGNTAPKWVTVRESEYIFNKKGEESKKLTRKSSTFEEFFGFDPEALCKETA